MSIIETRTRVCDRNPAHIIETGESVQPRDADAPPSWEVRRYGVKVASYHELCPRCLAALERNNSARVLLERDEPALEVPASPACEFAFNVGDSVLMDVGDGSHDELLVSIVSRFATSPPTYDVEHGGHPFTEIAESCLRAATEQLSIGEDAGR
jgi:hypothetical protein